MSARIFSLAICAALLLLLPLPARAEPSPVAAEVHELLDVGWERTTEARGAADEIFKKAHRIAPADGRLSYAYGLVLLKQRRYREAREHFAEAIASDPADLPAWRAGIWTLMLLKQFPQAAVQLEGLGAALPPEDAAEEIEAPRRATARFLGRMFGFLEGPAGKAAREEVVARHRDAILKQLTAARRDEFEAGRKAVLDQYDAFVLGHDEERDDARAGQVEAQARQEERIEQERGDIEGERAAMLERAEKLRNELDARLSEIDRRMAPLDASFNRLAADAVAVQNQMSEIDRRISQLLRNADETEDEDLRRRYLRDADRLAVVYRDYEARYLALDAEAREVNEQRSALAAEREDALARHEKDLDRLDDRSNALGRNEKRLDREQREAERPATGLTTRVRTLANRAKAFTTYEEFPLESERARVLEDVRRK